MASYINFYVNFHYNPRLRKILSLQNFIDEEISLRMSNNLPMISWHVNGSSASSSGTQVGLILCSHSLFTSVSIGPPSRLQSVVEWVICWGPAVFRAAVVPGICCRALYRYNFLFVLCCEKMRKHYAMHIEP